MKNIFFISPEEEKQVSLLSARRQPLVCEPKFWNSFDKKQQNEPHILPQLLRSDKLQIRLHTEHWLRL